MFYSKGTGTWLRESKGMIMERSWKVGDLAKLTGLTIRTLRYYDQIGLFSPSGYSESGHRLYNEADLSRLQQLLSLKELGLSLEEMKSILTGNTYSPLEVVSLQISRLQASIKLQTRLLEQLEHVEKLMRQQEPLNVDEFTKLLGLMKKNHERFFLERRTSWETSLDQLGSYLDNEEEQS
jgi:DNA-binding transcriptional MerR regulator